MLAVLVPDQDLLDVRYPKNLMQHPGPTKINWGITVDGQKVAFHCSKSMYVHFCTNPSSKLIPRKKHNRSLFPCCAMHSSHRSEMCCDQKALCSDWARRLGDAALNLNRTNSPREFLPSPTAKTLSDSSGEVLKDGQEKMAKGLSKDFRTSILKIWNHWCPQCATNPLPSPFVPPFRSVCRRKRRRDKRTNFMQQLHLKGTTSDFPRHPWTKLRPN